MTPTARWKLCCGVLLVGTIYSWTHRPSAPVAAAVARSPTARGERIRPVRVAPAAHGASLDALIEQLFAARRVDDVRAIAARIGELGDDRAVDAILPLIRDRRDGVPEAILLAIGAIGTDHAVDVLTARTERDYRFSDITVDALGKTHNPRAEDVLGDLALTTDDSRQSAAITALGTIGTDGAVELLVAVATDAPYSESDAAIVALARIATPHATATLVGLIDAPSLSVARSAIDAIVDVDDEMLARLSELVRSGPGALRDAAVEAMARAGAAGFAPLRELALRGPEAVKERAIVELVNTQHPEVFATLEGILASEPDPWMIGRAARALAGLDTPEARALLIETAQSGGRGAQACVEELLSLSGQDVDDTLASLTGDPEVGPQVVEVLLARGNPQVTADALARGRAASDGERYAVMTELSRAGTPAALDALTTLVKETRGENRLSGLSLLAQTHQPDAATIELFRDVVRHGTVDEAEVALSAVRGCGSIAARDVLIDALAHPDENLVFAAAAALEDFRMTDTTAAALTAAAAAHPSLAKEVVSDLVGAGSPEGFRLAEDAIAGDDAEAMQGALDGLGEARTDRSRDLLERSTRSEDPEVRGYAIEVLATSGDARAENVALDAFADPDASVRASAAGALGGMNTDRARDALIQLLRDPDETVRGEAARFLSWRPDLDAATRARIDEIYHPDEF